MKKDLTHFTKSGDAHMVDIHDKDITNREAVSSGRISMSAASIKKIKDGNHKKGDVLGIARIAAITASKKTSDLIPLCHNINLSSISIIFKVNMSKKYVYCEATASSLGKTGVEMEALTAVQIGLLTIYDMCKYLNKSIKIANIKLISKKGGKSGTFKS